MVICFSKSDNKVGGITSSIGTASFISSGTNVSSPLLVQLNNKILIRINRRLNSFVFMGIKLILFCKIIVCKLQQSLIIVLIIHVYVENNSTYMCLLPQDFYE